MLVVRAPVVVVSASADPAPAAQCRQVRWRSPAPDIRDPLTVADGEATPGTSVALACRYLALFTTIAEKAGQDLTYESFQQAGFALGSFQLPNYTDRATFGQDTPYGAIPYRRFDYDPAQQEFVLARQRQNY